MTSDEDLMLAFQRARAKLSKSYLRATGSRSTVSSGAALPKTPAPPT